MEFITNLISDAWADANTNEFFTGGLLLGLLTWLAYQAKGVPIFIWQRIQRLIRYTVYLDNTNPMYEAFAEWYLENFPKRFKKIEARLVDTDNSGHEEFKLNISQHQDKNIILYKGLPVFISKEKETLENAQSKTMRYVESYNISAYFGKRKLNRMLQEITTFWNQKIYEKDGVHMILPQIYAGPRSVYIKTFKTLDQIFFDGKDRLTDDIKNFLRTKEKYIHNGIKFKRGYLLYGKPGCGKTSTVVAIAHWLKMPLYYVNPTLFADDSSFEDFFYEIRPHSIVVIEDVDIFWQQRDDDDKLRISFQSLLNVMDGMKAPDDVLIFMTTNKVSNFDEAFLRKGRLDFKMKIEMPQTKQINKYLQNFYHQEVFINHPDCQMSMVDIQDICIKHTNPYDATNIIEEYCKN